MVLTEAMLEEIKEGAGKVEYGKVTIEIESRGNEPCLDIVVTARRRFQKSQPAPGDRPGKE
jgi:hypothetical protein